VNEGLHNRFWGPGGPSIMVRYLCYAAWWAPTLALWFIALPQFMPIFDKLEKRVELPQLTVLMTAFGRLNYSSYFLPLLACMLAFILLDAGVIALLRRSRKTNVLVTIWFIVMCCSSVAAAILVTYAAMAPTFVM
jgi:hypothetical protein